MGISAGCGYNGQAVRERAKPSVQPEVEEYVFDGTLSGRIGRDVRVTGYLRHEGSKGWPDLEKDLGGERGVPILGMPDPEVYLDHYVRVVGRVEQVPAPATRKPFGMGEQGLGVGAVYIHFRTIEEVPEPGD